MGSPGQGGVKPLVLLPLQKMVKEESIGLGACTISVPCLDSFTPRKAREKTQMLSENYLSSGNIDRPLITIAYHMQHDATTQFLVIPST